VDSGEIDVPESPKAASDKEMALGARSGQDALGHVRSDKHPDEYRAAVEAAVEEKVAADELARGVEPGAAAAEAEAPAATGGKVIDLAELLSRSLKKVEPKGGPRKAEAKEEAAAEEKQAPKKAKKRAAG